MVPARNERGLLSGALDSVAGQAAEGIRLEVVLVDNGSSDGTAEVARTWVGGHPELEMRVVAEGRRGRSPAKNAGAREARGRILVFLDADSVAEPGLAAAAVARERAGWPAGAIRVVADSADPLDRAYFWLMSLGPRLFGIRAQLLYCRRDLFLAVGGFDDRLELAEDKDLLDRLRRLGTPVCYLQESRIATSPRRLRALPLRLGMATLLGRWLLANFGFGRRRRY